jgi:hypothetical protein
VKARSKTRRADLDGDVLANARFGIEKS